MATHDEMTEDKRHAGPAMFFDDPLDVAAPLAHKLAGEHCRKDPVSGESCAWYHGSVLFIRTLNIGRSGLPDAHARFFAKALGELASDSGFGSILISGSADYRMPALVLNAYRTAGAAARLTVLDYCETPLLLTQWYVGRHGIAITVRHADILDYQPEEPADIICTHHFFNYFAPAARPGLVAKWRALLRRDGRVVIVNRFRAPCQGAAIGYPEHERAALVGTALAAARQRHYPFALSDDEIEGMVRVYSARIRAHAPGSPEELTNLLSAGGFAVESCTTFSGRRLGNRGAIDGGGTAGAVGIVARRL